ncbi:pentatricopeptide repeat-containing protein at4g21065 [Phtheirospermum japonicum]|uniref:Pentatricopeptide repeat-containing protein at4g21065 n=1 Tax=Phtheirospermum japonicum TaxID=374723 RepID=A0A830CPI0_9LAMI|nr:pentatricopeptide repeat-containing protein at4g21065 [Phtheirospermum japonicum]
MRAVSPKLDHPTLHLLKNCKTLETFKQAHAQTITTGLIIHTYPISRILLLSSTLSTLSYTLAIFNQISNPTIFLYNTLISSLTQNNHTKIALSLYDQMQRSLVEPNEVTLVALITACAELDALGQGFWAHVYVIRNGLSLNRFIGTALISLYSNSGCLAFARKVFDEMPQRDKFCFNAMIRGLAIHGHGEEALDLFDTMQSAGFFPDDVTILAVMSACAHVGLVDEGQRYFESMMSVYQLEPKLEHYCCLVDLLGRAGLVEEAKERVLTIPMKGNAILWRSLLGAARVHGNLEIAEISLSKLIELEPETSGNYVLLSNMYACLNRWDDVKRVRKLMRESGVDKTPGMSWVEVGGVMHEFVMGDTCHPRAKDINMKLEEMNSKLREFGHQSRISEVMFDIEEEEKGDALSCHSERLAIAFALIASDDDDSCGPIRVMKNLRVCVDCHSSIKILSLVYGREIVVRDRTRFHHFDKGACSCMDYW